MARVSGAGDWRGNFFPWWVLFRKSVVSWIYDDMFCNRGFRMGHFESFTVDEVGVLRWLWWCELASSSRGVDCGVVIPKEVFVVHVAYVLEKRVVDLVEVGWSR